MNTYLLAHDLGTSGNKAALFSTDGTLIGSQIVSYPTHYFHHNWVEQNAEDWWNAVCESTKTLLQTTKISPEEIAAVSFSGQMMGCLCVDKQGNPLRPAIIWADQRSQIQAAQVAEHISQKDYYNIVGHPNTASYGIQKLMWIRDNEPDIYEQTYKILNAKDYIVFRLTGTFCTDYSDGNSLGFFDLAHFQWSEELLSYAGIPLEKLPELKPSTYFAGNVTKKAALETGLWEGTKVILGAGDGVATNVGAGSISSGKTFCCLGTSAWITTTLEQPLFDESMRTVTWAHMIPGLYAPNGTMQYASGSYHWAKNTFCQLESAQAQSLGISPYELMNQLAAKSPVGANGVLFLPYLLGERAPRWNPDAKGCFIGLKAETSKEDLLRSVLEGIALNLAIILDILRSRISISEITVLGGGAKGCLLRQILADLFQTKIKTPHLLDEAGSMGAAVNAGVGAGIFSDFTAIDRFLTIDSVQEPAPDAASAYQALRPLFDDCYFALTDVFRKWNL